MVVKDPVTDKRQKFGGYDGNADDIWGTYDFFRVCCYRVVNDASALSWVYLKGHD